MLLQLSHVYKIYGELHAVDDLSLDVEKGEWLAIVGSSGSGKTTLMNIIGCMDTPTKGTVTLDGRELGRLNASQLTDIRKNVIGLVFQQFHLIAHLTAVENVMVAQYYHSMTDQKEAMEALENVGLGDRAHHLPSQLSGGEQQRVCIARALINHPEIILADEHLPSPPPAGHDSHRRHPRRPRRLQRSARNPPQSRQTRGGEDQRGVRVEARTQYARLRRRHLRPAGHRDAGRW